MKEFIKLPLTLVIVSVICAVIITATYQYTTPILEARVMEERDALFSEMYGDKLDNYEVIAENVSDEVLNVYKVNLTDGSTETAFEMSEIGKNGSIIMIISYDESKTLTHLNYLEINETPGIGSKVEEDGYVNSIVGQSSSNATADTITGATISSTAVKNAVEKSSELMNGGEYE